MTSGYSKFFRTLRDDEIGVYGTPAKHMLASSITIDINSDDDRAVAQITLCAEDAATLHKLLGEALEAIKADKETA